MIDSLPIGLILDIVIMVLLCATIAYVMRLTGYLKRFKESRSELENIIKNLSLHIDKADKAISGLNRAVDGTAEDLNNRMDRALKMFDELEMVVQTGDALANRLEDLAVRNRKIIDGGEGDAAELLRKTLNKEVTNAKRSNLITKTDVSEDVRRPVHSSFAIRDPDMERGEPISEEGFTLEDDEFLSEAERDLYEVLKKSNKTSKGK